MTLPDVSLCLLDVDLAKEPNRPGVLERVLVGVQPVHPQHTLTIAIHNQVCSLFKFYSVDYSKMPKQKVQQTHNRGLRQLFLTASLGHKGLASHT